MVWSKSKSSSRSQQRLAGSVFLAAATLWSSAAHALTFPSASPSNPQFNNASGQPRFFYQTSGPQRGLNIGDWYTSNTGGGNIGSAGRIHTLLIDIPPEAFTAPGQTVTITIEDGEVNGQDDEVSGVGSQFGLAFCTPTGNTFNNNPCRDTRFGLIGPGVVGQNTITFAAGSPDRSSGIFTVNQPGTYILTSQTDGSVDNGFRITVPDSVQPLIGQTQASFQQNDIDGDRTIGGTPINANFFFLVPPATPNLFLRNFDMDRNFLPNQTLTYTIPGAGSSTGTISTNAVWNGGGNTNTGGDPRSGAQPGIGQIAIGNLGSDNQIILEVRSGDGTGPILPLFDRPPDRAGNFTATPDTTRVTTPGVAVDHPFTITNNFITPDGFNLRLSGGNPNYTAQLIDPATNQPLTDNDGDGNPDIGVVGAPIPGVNSTTGQPEPGSTKQLILRVTPNPGTPATEIDTRVINVASFLDRTIAPATFQNREKQVTKITSIGGLGDSVFRDDNGNGVQDPGEPGIPNVTLTLRDPGPDNILGNADDPAPQTAVTDGNGRYNFAVSPERNYQVTVTPPTAFTLTTTQQNLQPGLTLNTQGNPSITGAPSSGFNFGFRPAGVNTIGDQVFNDVNGDGGFQANEPGIPGIQLSLTTPGSNGVFGDGDDIPVTTTVTDGNGRYSFPNLPDGQYRVSVVGAPAGLGATTPPFFDRTVAGGQTVVDADFGFRGSAIGQQVFFDLNRDGQFDPGEPGIPGVTVTLFEIAQNGTLTQIGQPVQTDANGRYSFTPPPGANYRVVVTPPNGTTLTTPANQDGVLQAGQIDLTRNFGILPQAGLRLVKRITNVTRNGTTIPGVDFTAIVDDPSTTDDNAPGWSQISLRGQIRVNGQTQIRSGDEITYTVYYLSEGTSPAFDVNLCDQIPEGTSFVLNTNQIQRSNTAPSPGGTAFSPLAPLPVGNACQNQTNPNGSVLFNLGEVSNVAGSNFGFVRFRVRIN